MSGNLLALRERTPKHLQNSATRPPPARTGSHEPGGTKASEPLASITQTPGTASQHQEQTLTVPRRADHPTNFVPEESAQSSRRLLPFNFYITRISGAKVPLIAVDELPPRYKIVGAPRVLPSNFEGGTDIIYAGHAEYPDEFHEVRQTGRTQRGRGGSKLSGQQKGVNGSEGPSIPIREPVGSPSGPPEQHNLPPKLSGALRLVHPLPPAPATGPPSPRRFVPRNNPHIAHPTPPMRGSQSQNVPPGSQRHSHQQTPYLQPRGPPGQYDLLAERTMPPYQPFPRQPFHPSAQFHPAGPFPVQHGGPTGYMSSPRPPLPRPYGAPADYMVSTTPAPSVVNPNDQGARPNQYTYSTHQPDPRRPDNALPIGYPNVYPWSNATPDAFGGTLT